MMCQYIGSGYLKFCGAPDGGSGKSLAFASSLTSGLCTGSSLVLHNGAVCTEHSNPWTVPLPGEVVSLEHYVAIKQQELLHNVAAAMEEGGIHGVNVEDDLIISQGPATCHMALRPDLLDSLRANVH